MEKSVLLGARAMNVLSRLFPGGITVNKVTKLDRPTLMSFPSVGARTANEIEAWLKAHGREFRGGYAADLLRSSEDRIRRAEARVKVIEGRNASLRAAYKAQMAAGITVDERTGVSDIDFDKFLDALGDDGEDGLYQIIIERRRAKLKAVA